MRWGIQQCSSFYSTVPLNLSTQHIKFALCEWGGSPLVLETSLLKDELSKIEFTYDGSPKKKVKFNTREWNVPAVRAQQYKFQNYWHHALIETKLHLKTSELARKVHLVVEIEHLRVEKVEIFPNSIEILK